MTMTCKWKSTAALALLASAGASTAQTMSLTLPCVRPADAEPLVQALIPELVVDIGRICASTLPATALVRQTDSAFLTRYRGEADIAWSRAQAGLRKILGGSDVERLLGSSMARPLLATLVTPALTRGVQPSDCPAIDRIVTLLEPLPPRSAAPLFVSVLQLVDARRTTRPERPTLRICQPGAR